MTILGLPLYLRGQTLEIYPLEPSLAFIIVAIGTLTTGEARLFTGRELLSPL